ncbi:Dolichyl-phosphate-mannose-protein mannosyltransferase [Chitinophaga sp. YR573]|uniref:ArnT family glycosyltransferase n=1 Tax=Chitinophaga sp. YR573 TaxID=1881040 RepID=UPI0008C41254|nr:glycosyltransferase family 39 protein [Chitinophaga sp. YR573]SEW17047.1 Dolichyl-phosphate-mannose-protein mannosyltransferase [Chitinophaga sp. YR573]
MNKAGFWANPGAVIKEYKLLTVTVLIILLLRLAFIGIMGLMPQDAYYSFYGEHPALSYFDHPPAIAYLLKTFTTIFGKKVFAIKLADTFITLLTLLSFYKLAGYFLSPRRTDNALLVFFSTLMVTILSLVSTPDVPLLLCWTLSLLCLYKAIFQHKQVWWILAGISMGLTFDSKYTGLLMPAGVVLFLILSNKYRRLLFFPWSWLAVLFFGITISPVIIWNVRNNLASFRFQSSERVSGFHINVIDFLGVVGHQAAILMPTLLFALCWLLYRIIKKYSWRIATIPQEKLFLLCFFVPVFAGFFLLSFVTWVKLNWMMPAYITGIILITPYFSKKLIRWQLWFALVVHLSMAVEILCYPVAVKSDDIWLGWGNMANDVKILQHKYPKDFIFSADDYKTSAVLNFYMNEMVYGQNILGRPALQFDYIGTDLNTLKGRNALFINSLPDVKDDFDEKGFVADLNGYFDNIIPLTPIVIHRNGKVVRKFLVYRCENYHPEFIQNNSH